MGSDSLDIRCKKVVYYYTYVKLAKAQKGPQ